MTDDQLDILEQELREQASLQEKIEISSGLHITFDHIDGFISISCQDTSIYITPLEAEYICEVLKDILSA